MKRFFLILLVLSALASVAGSQTITVLHQGDQPYANYPDWKYSQGFTGVLTKLEAAYEALNPGIDIVLGMQDLSTGAPLSLEAALAAKRPPSLIDSGEGVVSKLMVPDYAIVMDQYVNVSDYSKVGLDRARRGGKLYGLPNMLSSSAMMWNLDMLSEVGYKLPAVDAMTTDEFLKVARLLKAKGHYVTILFAKNQSSDMWWMTWFYAFGAQQYKPGDYTKSTLNTPAAVKALKFLKQLVDERLVPPNPSELDDDQALDMWAKGEAAALPMQIGHATTVDSYVKQGILKKAFAYDYTEVPHAVGQKHTPVYTGQNIVVGHLSGDAKIDRLIAGFAELMTGFEWQYLSGRSGNFPTRATAVAALKDTMPAIWNKQIGIINTAGVIDRGAHLPVFSQTRGAMFPLMQEFYAGKMTAEVVLKTYATAIDKILSGK